jgi:hypothetical protein
MKYIPADLIRKAELFVIDCLQRHRHQTMTGAQITEVAMKVLKAMPEDFGMKEKDTEMKNFISREHVLYILEAHGCPELTKEAVRRLPSFPAPNPEELGGRNVMGQTEDEFWDAVERQDVQGQRLKVDDRGDGW